MKLIQNKLIQGTLLLTIAGFITRIIGFAYRIFLSDVLGAKLLGVYQLVFPVYSICFTIYAAGIQTAISQLIASSIERPDCKKERDIFIMKCGMVISTGLALLLTAAVYLFAEPISHYLLLEEACAPYLRILCILFIPCGITSCINGYFYGKKDARVPAMTQIVEQLARVSSVALLCMLLSAASETGCRLAVLGLVIGETTSSLYNCFCLWRELHTRDSAKKDLPLFKKTFQKQTSGSYQKGAKTARTRRDNSCPKIGTDSAKLIKNLLFLAFTLTVTKLVISSLHSIESVFIPAALKDFGCSAREALGTYGVLSGISMPFILFPSTVTNSFAVMLLPAIAQAQAEKREDTIQKYVTLSSKYCLLIGYLFTCIFLLFGRDFGTWLFHSPEAGLYIYLLSWLCPFLYLSTTFTSIINGLGQTQLTFLITTACLAVKIYFLVVLVPKSGIQAYLIGSLISQIIMTLLEGIYLRKYLKISYGSFFIIPGISLGLLGLCIHKVYLTVPVPKNGLSMSALIFASCLALAVGYLLALKLTGCVERQKKT